MQAEALLLAASRRSTYHAHPFHKDMHIPLAQCREAVAMMGAGLHVADEEEEGDFWDDDDDDDGDYSDEDDDSEFLVEGEEDEDFEEEEGEEDMDSLAAESMEGDEAPGQEGGGVGEAEADLVPPLVGFTLAAVPYNQQQLQQQQAQQQQQGEEQGEEGGDA